MDTNNLLPPPLDGKPLVGTRVLFVVTEDWYFVSHRLRFARWLCENGCQVAVACRVGREQQRIEAEGIEVLPVDVGRKGLGPIAYLRQILALRQTLLCFRPDLIHAVALRAILVTRPARSFSCPKTPLVNAVAGMGSLFSGELKAGKHRIARAGLSVTLRWLLKGSSVRTVFQNSDDLQLAFNQGWCREGGAELIPGVGVPVPEKMSAAIGGAAGFHDPVRLLFVGRLLRDKGIEILLEASVQLHAHGVRHELEIVGEGDAANPSSLNSEDMAEWKSREWMHFQGRRDDVAARIARSDIVVLPTYREGMPKVLLEAGAAAKPVVTCDVPGCRDLVIDGETGLLVPAREVDALADALEKLIGDSEVGTRMGRRNLERLEQHYSEKKIFPQFARLYGESLRIEEARGGRVA